MTVFALLLWPVLALMLFAKRDVMSAILIGTVVPYLMLPEAFAVNLPGIPDLDKTVAVSLGLVGGLVCFGARARGLADLPQVNSASRTFRLLLLACIAAIYGGSILTVMNNRDMLFFGPTVLPAMRPWDAVALFGSMTLFLIPFFVARKYLATPPAHRALLQTLVVAGLGYSLLMAVELRLSPQLHNWIYGYHQHSFFQHIRDGFRPMVFLEHGLWVGFFMFASLIAAAALWKSERDSKWLWAGLWIFTILMVSKNLGAFAIALMCLAIIFTLWRKMQIMIVIAIALMTLTYPALRQAQLIPIEQIMSAASSVSEDRAGSLQFRLDNEDLLLERALLKPVTGWGGWGRDRLYDERGRDISITDGRWIITLGAWGWLGYLGLFGMLGLPLISLALTARRKEISYETIGLALICSGNLIYMIPNATLTPVGMLCFGALAGFAQFDMVKETGQSAAQTEPDPRVARRYTRFPQSVRRRGAG